MEQYEFGPFTVGQNSRVEHTVSFLRFVTDPTDFEMEFHTGENDYVRVFRKTDEETDPNSIILFEEDLRFMERQAFGELRGNPNNRAFLLAVSRFDQVKAFFTKGLQQ